MKYEYILNNGIKMPSVGLGVFMLTPTEAYTSVRFALENGCKLIDTAGAYVNERAVGRAIKDSLVNREDIFVSSKIWASEYGNSNAVEETLNRLNLDYVDLLFLHQPSNDYDYYLKGYRLLEKAYKEGKIKAIGLSNSEGKYLDFILANCEIKPQVVQVECHPYFNQEEWIIDKLIPNNLRLMSWYPLGHGDSKLLNEEVFKRLASKYNKSVAQIILRWHIDKGFIVIPGSKNLSHVKDNLDILDFSLSNDDLELIDKIHTNTRYYNRNDLRLEQYKSWQPQYEVE
jgi:diketogulonate reductase-like aldo/keto reductase